MDGGYGRCAVTNCKSNALGTPAPAVIGSEHARKTGLDCARWPHPLGRHSRFPFVRFRWWVFRTARSGY